MAEGDVMAGLIGITRPEIWAGVECTVNRIGDRYLDQLERSGHAVRLKDLKRLADLGVRTIRFPILWERMAPEALDRIDWSLADEQLETMRRLDLKPIASLVHHGSGPRYTELLDPQFPEKLATYAGAVAKRFPWITDYTPINEPLTTARFSCLYGHWYPHQRDPLLFAKAFLAQCRGVVMAMHSIRTTNPSARLIQTEDFGKSFSTPTLAYQAEFENERRWLTFDLLCGRIVPGTHMWDYFLWVGVDSSELEWFVENQCHPDLLGVNHYITSERFLDERTNRYPSSFHGGNGRHFYADVEAVRVCAEGVAGPKVLLREVWNRFHLPLAITEVHLGCTREEQLRWLNEVWNAALDLRAENVDIRAVTAWAAFGAFDWNSLLTSEAGVYEPGIFDLRSPVPRPTALARMVKTIAHGEAFHHPLLGSPGWWHRLDRLCYPPVKHRDHALSSSRSTGREASGNTSQLLLITGATGTLGQAFARVCEKRGLAYQLVSRKQLDIADRDSVKRALDEFDPWAIVNAAGYVRVDDAESDQETCYRDNVTGPAMLAMECNSRRLPLVTFSSDLVFDGLKREPYVESDLTAPLNVYGRTKVEAENRVRELYSEALIVRTSAFFGPWDTVNFVRVVLETLAKGTRLLAAADQAVSPTYVPELVNSTLDLLIDGEFGIWHLANSGHLSWADFARLIAEKGGYDPAKVEGRWSHSLGLVAQRPAFTALASERGRLMSSLGEGLDRFFQDTRWSSHSRAMSASR